MAHALTLSCGSSSGMILPESERGMLTLKPGRPAIHHGVKSLGFEFYIFVIGGDMPFRVIGLLIIRA